MDKRNQIKRTQFGNKMICGLRKQGKLYKIGNLFGISRQRANQICDAYIKHIKNSKQHIDNIRNEF